MGQTTVTFEIADAPPPRLDKALGRDVPARPSLSRPRLARVPVDGAVTVDAAVSVSYTHLPLPTIPRG